MRSVLTATALTAALIVTGAPLASAHSHGGSGATVRTASTKRRRTALSLLSPLGATSILTSPSADTQALLSNGGSASIVTRSRAKQSVKRIGVNMVWPTASPVPKA